MQITNSEIKNRINLREIYRYLGYGKNIPDDDIKAVIDEVVDSLINVIKPKNIYKIYDCHISGEEIVFSNSTNESDMIEIKSKNLSENLFGCKKAVLMAATLGLEADKLMQKYEIINMAKASITQSCGAACIEAYCNILQEKILDSVMADTCEKLYLRPRFSPGYGDVPLELQREIFRALECTKRIGLTLTESLLMYPTKSVTAFIGLTTNPQSCHVGRCSNCEKIDCEFRETDS
jgi:cobalamin-dependent methionine synthase I